jgi:tRNA pseudouridine55 synthase
MTDAVILVNKKKGITSFDVVSKIRRTLKVKRVGHAGTLDPMAEGVLPVFIGRATLACDILPDSDKSYLATFKLGYATDTQDTTGTILNEKKSCATKDEVEKALLSFKGEIMQIPPMYSAIKVDGRKLYELAREGKTVEVEPRKITVYSISLYDFDEKHQSGVFSICCSKGTYIRTICHDLGLKLGTFGVMSALTRTSAAGFNLNDCYTEEEIEEIAINGNIEDILIPVEKVFKSLNKITLNQKHTHLFLNGVKLRAEQISTTPDKENHAVYSFDNRFLGLGYFDGDIFRVKKLFTTKQMYEEGTQ